VSEPGRILLEPRGPFSLALAARFEFGPRAAEADAALVRLAFCVDGFREHAGVVVREDERGLSCELTAPATATPCAARWSGSLSLDQDGEEWAKVGERDAVIGALQERYRGLRPVLFHSPYEAAAWSIISTRYARPLAARLRDRIAAELGREFELAGERVAAFPLPERLLELRPMAGLGEQKAERLRELAGAALEGRLDPERLRRLDPDEAIAEVRRLRGIGPFYAGLIVVRGAGVTDVLPLSEPRVLRAAAHWYGLEQPPSPDEFEKLAERWRPFRTWAAVLLRFAWGREVAR
jgi:DNA-3-methyladenine glycosylase II